MARNVTRVIVAGLLCLSGLSAQTKPSFEAASIKAVPDSVGWPPRAGYWVQPQMENPQRLRALTLLSQIIEWAYDVRDFQLEGGPSWLKQGRFEYRPPQTTRQRRRK